ncbi:PTS system cellobiose-specific IIC component [Fontibacillus solani]|uniref:Permease IIC component n=1 Tax=Fontibacillus solani TaxID=1572857 RepID=A0A7W3SXA2_9BACL|nr:PTS transporter subunit EIIC [Fontibacillus solani]MBA9087927.1 PTS system cellobiose-specific IIC component [Fontibacillus solani]
MKINAEFTGKISALFGKISNSVVLKSLMAGMMAAFPATIVGSFATILKGLQIQALQDFYISSRIMNVFDLLIMFSINVTALYVVAGIAYGFAKQKQQDAIPAAIIALFSFLIITPYTATPTEYGTVNYSISMGFLGGSGMFSAIIVGLIVGFVYSFIKEKGWTIKLPDSVPPVVSSSFAGIIPGLILSVFFAVMSTIFLHTSFGSIHQAIYSILQTPLMGISSNIWTMLLVIFLGQILWFFGIHGPMVILSVMAPIWMAVDLQNLTAFNAGEPLPNVIGMAFYTISTIGGTALGLAICMILFAKSSRFKTLGRLSIVPGIFGITEPLIFGTPLVMNVRTFIPAVFLPVFSALLSYLAIASGLLPRMSGVGVPQGVPIILQGILQGSWLFGLLQLVLVVIWTLCWYPFFKKMDGEALREETA